MMRISSNLLYQSTVADITRHQADLVHTQRQLSSGQKILTASDDPVAAAKAMDISQADAMNAQYGANRDRAQSVLSFTETTLHNITNVIHDVRDRALNAGSGVLNEGDRRAIAADLQGRLQQLIGLANTRDESGNYLFAGYQTDTAPFRGDGNGVQYVGDDGQKQLQVSPFRKMDVSFSGADLFMRNRDTGASITVNPLETNIGDATATTATVTAPEHLVDSGYQLTFADDGANMTYRVVNTTTNAEVVPAGTIYEDGGAIEFDGLRFAISGDPVDGDVFNVPQRANESLFDTVQSMVNALQSPLDGQSLGDVLKRGVNNLDNALESVVNARTVAGQRLNEVDSMDEMGAGLDVLFKESLSDLRDVDFAEAASRLVQQQSLLQAAQQSFSKVESLTLFDYLR